MISPQLILDLNHQLIIDNFAGGGGASTGIELALGRHADHAINHNAEALGMHRINHPQTVHHCEDVFDVDPLTLTEGRPVGLAWFSPDCKHFSKAKGSKPVDKKIRGLVLVMLRWAKIRP
ncbi:MAG: DNA cytosine methyltransferase, partial [Roseimicrobium sp.]